MADNSAILDVSVSKRIDLSDRRSWTSEQYNNLTLKIADTEDILEVAMIVAAGRAMIEHARFLMEPDAE